MPNAWAEAHPTGRLASSQRTRPRRSRFTTASRMIAPSSDTTRPPGRIRLRHLQCFLAIVQNGTLGSAAQALSITQPAVTKTVNELEEILGAKLFERGRKGVTLTPEAEVFVPHANASMEALAR